MNVNMNKHEQLDNVEHAARTAFMGVAVDTAALKAGVIARLGETTSPRRSVPKRGATLVAAAMALIILTTTAFSALGGFERFLTRFDPPFAEVIMPVMAYVEHEDIRMSVIGANRFDNMAIVYLSLHDTSGANRLTERSSFSRWLRVDMDRSGDSPGWAIIFLNPLYFDEHTNTLYKQMRISAAADTSLPEVMTVGGSRIVFDMDYLPRDPGAYGTDDTIATDHVESARVLMDAQGHFRVIDEEGLFRTSRDDRTQAERDFIALGNEGGVSGEWFVQVDTSDTVHRMITFNTSDNADAGVLTFDFITLSPLGLQASGGREGRSVPPMIAQIETAEGIFSVNGLGGRFDGNAWAFVWLPDDAIDVDAVTAVIIDGRRMARLD